MALDADWQGTVQTCKKLVPISNDLQAHSRCESSSGLFYVSVFVMQPKGKKKPSGWRIGFSFAALFRVVKVAHL